MLQKAMGSRKNFYDGSRKMNRYLNCVEDLLEDENVLRLDSYSQHIGTSRLQHSLNVSYYSYLFSKLLGCDCRSAARAGILHDLYLYDRHTDKTDENHVFRHPREALKNAAMLTELNDIERDAIIKHMWPLSKGFPKYKESYCVSAADKYSAALEFTFQLGKKVKNFINAS